jgi:hypothetical protein
MPEIMFHYDFIVILFQFDIRNFLPRPLATDAAEQKPRHGANQPDQS